MVTHVVKNGKVVIAFCSPLNIETEFSKEHSAHLTKHGDGVREVCFRVEDCEKTFNTAVSRGCKVVKQLEQFPDANGKLLKKGSVMGYGETIHSFLERGDSDFAFLPGFKILPQDPINEVFGVLEYGFIDHIVGNHPLGDMEPTVQWYEKMLDFHRFWSVDDSTIHTEYR